MRIRVFVIEKTLILQKKCQKIKLCTFAPSTHGKKCLARCFVREKTTKVLLLPISTYILNLLILIFFLFPSGKVSKARQKASGHKLKNKNFKARDYGKAGAIQIIRDTPGVNFTNILRASFEFGAKNYKAVFWL